jgi:hypothetical protein
MSENDRKEILTNIKNYHITDLVNSTAEIALNPPDTSVPMKVAEFYHTDYATRLKAITQPEIYLIF